MKENEMRKERIERLLYELRYELERGFMEGEVDETITWQYIVPVSRSIKEGVVYCRFETRPVHRDSVMFRDIDQKPRLKLVE